MKSKQLLTLALALFSCDVGRANWEQDFDEDFARAINASPELVFTYATTYPTNIVLGASYAGPADPSKALYDSGNGWTAYTSKNIPVSSKVVKFKGDWRDSSGRFYSLFKATFSAGNNVAISGKFDVSGTPATGMFSATFSGCSGLTYSC